jgi:predicted CoA-substrate-specific enzyme activase
MSNKYYVGIDAGTSYVKALIITKKKKIKGFSVHRCTSDLQKSISLAFNEAVEVAGVSRDRIEHITATGFGRRNVTFADSLKTEISSHAKGAYHYFEKEMTIIDIGAQDTKIIKVDKDGSILGFKMNRKCAAGTGTFLEEIANRLDIPMSRMNTLASDSSHDIALSSFCTVFACTEILSRIKEGEKTEDMVRSAFESVARRVIEMDTLDGTIVVTGGVVEFNDVILEILGRYIKGEILTPPHPQLIGALGAALFARET